MASSKGLSKFYTRVVSQTGIKPSGSVLFLHGSGTDVKYAWFVCEWDGDRASELLYIVIL